MAQEVKVSVSDDHTLKPLQSDGEDADFPEFEFPVGDGGDDDISSPNLEGISAVSNKSVDMSPKKMPPALREEATETLLARVSVRLSEEVAQPEVSKHVVTEMSKPASVLLEGPKRKVLQSNPSFKSLVNILGERTASPTRLDSLKLGKKHRENGELKNETEVDSEEGKLTAPAHIKRLSLVSRATQTQSTGGKTKLANELSVNALVEKFSRNKLLEEAARALSGTSTPRNLSERRTMADRSRSPVPRHLQDNGNSDGKRALSPVPGNTANAKNLLCPRRSVTTGSTRTVSDRSVSPIPRASSWKDSVYGDVPKEKRPNFSAPSPPTPPPRFLTPTRAAALKAVKPPATPNHASSKGSLHTAFGITTPAKEIQKKNLASSKPDHPKATVTEPAGFNFRTDQRAERRKDYNAKVEERLKLKEAERKRQEQKAQEEKEAQLRELRKSLTYKANPVPRFYQEPAPIPPEIRKPAPTRAKSPNFTAPRRRESCPGSTVSESGRTSPLRSSSRLLRCASLESNSGHSGYYAQSKPAPKKQPFRPV
ncbi:uncharacterized protein [Physcomitrium patens]|uniref:TPX2 C-terminal domain-containing protein n=1 Tax=Physcomitrium patens TaxID=3218 RepID=A0A2K1L7W6_PHYPA|nr:hypothetical protein PHYPA_000541 [Physcomitrium patens]